MIRAIHPLAWTGKVSPFAQVKLSIVIPVFNDVRVGRALDSVLEQQHDHALEVIVIDAGSDRATLAVLERYAERLTVFVSAPDRGIFDGLNKGIERATGDVVGALGADDRYSDPGVFRDVMALLRRHPDLSGCYGNLAYVDDRGREVRYWKSSRSSRLKWFLGWSLPHFTVFARRRVYERHGVFDLAYEVAADYEWELRLLFKRGLEFAHLDRTVLAMAPGGHAHGSLGNVLRGNLEAGRAWRRNGLRGGLLVPLLKPLHKVPQLLRRSPEFARRRRR